MHQVSACCFGGSILCYLWRNHAKIKARNLKSAIRVKDLKGLGELVGDSTSSHLVVVSGKVGSEQALRCNRSGVLGVNLIEKVEVIYLTKSGACDCEREFDSEEVVLSRKSVPWFLEDDSGRVNVVGTDVTFRRELFDEPVNKLYERMLWKNCYVETEILHNTCSEDVLEIGTTLTIVAKAFKDGDGNPCIKAQSSQVYNGYINIDSEVYKLESYTAFYGYLSVFLAFTGLFVVPIPGGFQIKFPF